MSFGIKQIKAILAENGMPTDNLETCAKDICERHKAMMDGVIEERDNFKRDSDALREAQKELDELKKTVESVGKSPYEEKYNSLKKEYDEYKKGIETQKIHEKKQNAYRNLLKSAGIAEKRIDSVLKVSNVDEIEFDEKGAIINSDKYANTIKSEWADFIESSETQGADTSNPPSTGTQANRKRTGRAAELAKRYQETMYGANANKAEKE